MKLSSSVLREIGKDCVTFDKDNSVIVQGISHTGYYIKEKLEEHRAEIEELLDQLPSNFKKSSGGGWSFLNACMDKEENQWGEQIDVELLMMLGIAIGKVEYCLPREMWRMLPGGVPYFVIND